MTHVLLILLWFPLLQPPKPAVVDPPAPTDLILPRPGLDLLGLSEVQAELKLAEEQKRLIADLKKDLDKHISGGGLKDFRAFLQLSPEERSRRVQQARAATEAAARKADDLLAVILDSTQLERLRQLRLQRQGPEAMGTPTTADALQLTEAQRAAVRKLLAEPLAPPAPPRRPAAEDSETARKQAAAEIFKMSDEDWDKAMHEARQRRHSQLLGLLTADQKWRWQTLLGKPFPFPKAATPGR